MRGIVDNNDKRKIAVSCITGRCITSYNSDKFLAVDVQTFDFQNQKSVQVTLGDYDGHEAVKLRDMIL